MNRDPLRLDFAELFKFDRAALDLTKPTIGIAIVLVALILLSVVGPFGFTAAFGAVLAVSFDGGGARRQRLVALGIFAVAGALLTYLGNAASASTWASIALVFGVTLLCGMALAFGPCAGKMAFMLNLWMMIARSLAVAIDAPDRTQAARTSWQRAIGTIIGVAVAAVVLSLNLTPTTLLLLWLLVLLVMLAVQGVNYVLYAAVLTLSLLLLYQLLEADVIFNGMDRLVTTLLGIALALGAVSMLAYLAQRAAPAPEITEP